MRRGREDEARSVLTRIYGPEETEVSMKELQAVCIYHARTHRVCFWVPYVHITSMSILHCRI